MDANENELVENVAHLKNIYVSPLFIRTKRRKRERALLSVWQLLYKNSNFMSLVSVSH